MAKKNARRRSAAPRPAQARPARVEQLRPEEARYRLWQAGPMDALDRAVAAERTAAEDVARAVRSARAGGVTWAVIGSVLGCSGEWARRRYADA